jgi:hypothetical protein
MGGTGASNDLRLACHRMWGPVKKTTAAPIQISAATMKKVTTSFCIMDAFPE